MPIETFRDITYSNPEKFVRQDSRISLKKYREDLLLYGNFDSGNNAEFAVGEDTPTTTTGTISIDNDGVFSQHLFIENGSVTFDAVNFSDLKEEGSISFFLKPAFNNAPGEQSFVATSAPTITTLPTIDTDTHHFGGASLSMIGAEEKRIEYNVDNISSLIQEGTIDFFFKTNYSGSPSTQVTFFDFYNETDNNNRIRAFHQTDGNIYFEVYDQTGVKTVDISFAWSADSNWHNISFNFDLNNGSSKVFADGTQYGSEDTSTGTRVALSSGYMAVGASQGEITNFYLDDFAVYSSKQFSSNYSVRNTALEGSETNLIVYANYDTSKDLDVGNTTSPTEEIPPSSNYEFRLSINGTVYNSGDLSITLNTDDTMGDIANKLSNVISGADANVNLLSEGNIQIQGDDNGSRIEILQPNDGRSFIDLLGGVTESIIPNAPSSDTNIAEVSNSSNNNNRIVLTHTTESKIRIIMFDSSGNEQINTLTDIWTNEDINWYHFELNWNETIGQFFLEGKLWSVFSTGFSRNGSGALTLRAGSDFYRFDELKVFNVYQHAKSFQVPTTALTAYPTDIPYIDIDFGTGFREDEVVDLSLNSSSNCAFVIRVGSDWMYYFSGSWQISDGSYSQSVDPGTLETKFSELFFSPEQSITIRVYFESDGVTEAWIDEIDIVSQQYGENAATITGRVSLSDSVDLSSDSHVTISTNKESKEVDLTSQLPEQPAEHIGNADLSSGYDWATDGNESFDIDGNTITLDQDTAHADAIVTMLNNKLPSSYEAFQNGSGFIGIRTDETGSNVSMTLSENNNGLSRLGITAATYNGSDPDLTSVSLSEIKQAINAANIDGLAPAAHSENDELVLISSDTGADAFVSIEEGTTSNALPIVWGFASSDFGGEQTDFFFDYSEIFDWIRAQLGAPTVPVELTDEQLEYCASRAIYWYNYYMNKKESLLYAKLEGNVHDGYKIPDEVGGEEDIIEIIVKPRFPFAYYTGGDVNSIMSNLYMQWMFQSGRNTSQFKDFLGDYYITLSTEKDYEIILGTQIKWWFYNGRIFISPKPDNLDVIIRYRSAVSMEQINTDPLIREYALGEAKKILGQIRSTFGNTIPGGTENIQLNGAELKQEGQQEVQQVMEKMMKLQEPVFLDWG